MTECEVQPAAAGHWSIDGRPALDRMPHPSSFPRRGRSPVARRSTGGRFGFPTAAAASQRPMPDRVSPGDTFATPAGALTAVGARRAPESGSLGRPRPSQPRQQRNLGGAQGGDRSRTREKAEVAQPAGTLLRTHSDTSKRATPIRLTSARATYSHGTCRRSTGSIRRRSGVDLLQSIVIDSDVDCCADSGSAPARVDCHMDPLSPGVDAGSIPDRPPADRPGLCDAAAPESCVREAVVLDRPRVDPGSTPDPCGQPAAASTRRRARV